jgi:farnesyl diphosphate synthase
MTAEFLAPFQNRIEVKLAQRLNAFDQPKPLSDAMAYACLGGGKRLRAALVYLSAEALGLNLDQADSTAIAVELIHGYSLIHDDLPAMDDDPLRRGKPSTHIEFGDALAILAGDALQALAFQTLAEDTRLNPEARLRLIQALSGASGINGMVGGQVRDMTGEHQALNLSDLTEMHALKTGALIEFSAASGAMIDGNQSNREGALRHFGAKLGLAFQVQDDILDETSSTETLGKQQGSDRAQAKSTFVSLLGLEAAQEHLADLIDTALSLLKQSQLETDNLLALVHYMAERKY